VIVSGQAEIGMQHIELLGLSCKTSPIHLQAARRRSNRGGFAWLRLIRTSPPRVRSPCRMPASPF